MEYSSNIDAIPDMARTLQSCYNIAEMFRAAWMVRRHIMLRFLFYPVWFFTYKNSIYLAAVPRITRGKYLVNITKFYRFN